MAGIKFGTYSRSFQKFYTISHLAAAGLCLLFLVLTVLGDRSRPLTFVPWIFTTAGLLAIVDAVSVFRLDSRGQRSHLLPGFGYAGAAVLMFALAYVAFMCL